VTVIVLSVIDRQAVRANERNVRAVAETPGLVAFWDFHKAKGGKWISIHDPSLDVPSFPVSLRQIGDSNEYGLSDWPYRNDESALRLDSSGPFGNAVRFNQGYLYGSVDRKLFDHTLLNLHGRKPFTMIAWTKFIGGGWDKYGGRRQAALFAGLFGQKGVIAHISATGAACFPQSLARGSQYARSRAIDGQPFENRQWVSMAMVYDPDGNEVRAYLDGKMTSLALNDPVADSVYRFQEAQSANPFRFLLLIYSPRSFILKYNGYRPEEGIREHRLMIDLNERTLEYEREEYDFAPASHP